MVEFVCPASFPLPPPLYGDERGATAREGRRRWWGGGHSIGTPRHSEGNHPKYFPLCVARALGLLLLAHTHTHIHFEKVLKVKTHSWPKCSSHITQFTLTLTLSGIHTEIVQLWRLVGSLYLPQGERAVILSVSWGTKSGKAIVMVLTL